jgi:hypothetical protein
MSKPKMYDTKVVVSLPTDLRREIMMTARSQYTTPTQYIRARYRAAGTRPAAAEVSSLKNETPPGLGTALQKEIQMQRVDTTALAHRQAVSILNPSLKHSL